MGDQRRIDTLERQLAEAEARQEAVSAVLRAITDHPGELEQALDSIADNAVRFCNAEGSLIHLVRDNSLLIMALSNWSAFPERAAEAQADPQSWRGHRLPLDRGTIVGAAVLDRSTTQAPDLGETVLYPETRRFAKNLGFRAMVTSPIYRGEQIVGAISLRRVEPGQFSDRDLALLSAFAIHAGTAIENARLFNETKEALERQTAISEILRAIGRSAFDLSEVLDTVLSRAATLLTADLGCIYRYDGTGYRLDARFPGDFPTASAREIAAEGKTAFIPWFNALVPSVPTAAVFLERRTVHMPDVLASDGFRIWSGDPRTRWYADLVQRLGIRTDLAVPLRRDDRLLGVLELMRTDLKPFAPGEIGLLETFADQASIAIDSVRMFNEIQDKSAQLAAASQHKSEFLANMSHELRTPLNAIIGFSEVLKEGMFGELNERQREYIEDIRSSGAHQLALINDILDLSKVEAGRMELDLGEVSIATVVDDALLLVRERAAQHGITVAAEIAQDLPLLTADARKLKQVLLNLVTNAVKFTPDGGWIGVTARQEGDDLTIAVRDTGVGIAPDDLARIFEEFRQAKRRDGSVEGTGLGLALTKKIVELHGGRISLESEVGKGSTFTVRLPLRPASVTA